MEHFIKYIFYIYRIFVVVSDEIQLTFNNGFSTVIEHMNILNIYEIFVYNLRLNCCKVWLWVLQKISKIQIRLSQFDDDKSSLKLSQVCKNFFLIVIVFRTIYKIGLKSQRTIGCWRNVTESNTVDGTLVIYQNFDFKSLIL